MAVYSAIPAGFKGRSTYVLEIAGVLLFAHGVLLAWSASRLSPTIDEPRHLGAGICRLVYARFDLDPGNPPLLGTVAAVPVLSAGADARWGDPSNAFCDDDAFLKANGPKSFWLVTLGRWACIPFSLLGGYVCFRWAYELYGSGSGLLALALWCFCPSVMANGPLITGDIVASAMGAGVLYIFWTWLTRPSWARAWIAGIVLGVAQVSKFVWVMLYVLLPLLWLAWRCLHRRPSQRGMLLREIGQGVLIVAMSVYVINLSYLFEGPFHPLREFRAGHRILEPLKDAPRVAACAASAPLPFPMRYVKGIGAVEEVCDTWSPSSVEGGGLVSCRSSFFVCALLLKLPLGSLTIVALACAVSFVRGYSGQWKTELMLAASAAAVLGFVTWTVRRTSSATSCQSYHSSILRRVKWDRHSERGIGSWPAPLPGVWVG